MSSILFVGGTRSGKSGLGQQHAESLGERRLYVATACASPLSAKDSHDLPEQAEKDAEMQKRIKAHQDARKFGWQTFEAYGRDFSDIPTKDVDVVLIDCLTLWLSAQLFEDKNVEHALQNLERFIQNCPLPLIMISSEVGQGIVPMGALSREFRDWHGLLNQRVARLCETVLLVSCGLPLALKGKVPYSLTA